MRHRQIEAFRAVMIGGTITEAAGILRVSQPSVSRLITDLERSLDLALFDRRQGRVTATPEAIKLFEEVERSFASLDKLRRFVREMRDFREADLTVAAMPALCLDLLPLAVSTFLGNYPQARVSLHARSSEQVIDWIIGHQCAFGLAAPPYDLRGVKCEAEISVPCVCVLPAGHPLADREFITPADLAEQNIVLLTNTILRHRLERVFDAAGVPLADRIETPLSIVACRMVELGLGVGIFEPFTARYCLDRSIIVRRFEPAVPFNFGVLSPHGRTRSAAAQELLAVLHRTLNALDLPCGIQVNASKLDD